jgi:hypothetical protein
MAAFLLSSEDKAANAKKWEESRKFAKAFLEMQIGVYSAHFDQQARTANRFAPPSTRLRKRAELPLAVVQSNDLLPDTNEPVRDADYLVAKEYWRGRHHASRTYENATAIRPSSPGRPPVRTWWGKKAEEHETRWRVCKDEDCHMRQITHEFSAPHYTVMCATHALVHVCGDRCKLADAYEQNCHFFGCPLTNLQIRPNIVFCDINYNETSRVSEKPPPTRIDISCPRAAKRSMEEVGRSIEERSKKQRTEESVVSASPSKAVVGELPRDAIDESDLEVISATLRPFLASPVVIYSKAGKNFVRFVHTTWVCVKQLTTFAPRSHPFRLHVFAVAMMARTGVQNEGKVIVPAFEWASNHLLSLDDASAKKKISHSEKKNIGKAVRDTRYALWKYLQDRKDNPPSWAANKHVV